MKQIKITSCVKVSQRLREPASPSFQCAYDSINNNNNCQLQLSCDAHFPWGAWCTLCIRNTVGEVSGEDPKKIKWWFTPHTKECSSTCHELLSFNHAINNVHKLKCTNVHLNSTDNSSEHKLPNLKWPLMFIWETMVKKRIWITTHRDNWVQTSNSWKDCWRNEHWSAMTCTDV